METSLPLLRVLSLGAGVQSSALYLMAVHGEFPGETPDIAIFADTQWEPPATYAWLDELERIGGSKIPIRRVTRGSLRSDFVEAAKVGARIPYIPYFTQDPNNPGKAMPSRRGCTMDYKITPLKQETRRALVEKRVALGVTGRLQAGEVETWIGISTDEATRMKDSKVAYINHRWPLIERRMSRTDCENWVVNLGLPRPPKSACIGCPYHSNEYWQDMKKTRPEEWGDAVEFDNFLRDTTPGGGGLTVLKDMRTGGGAYLHRSLTPLVDADIRTKAEKAGQINLFENECEGMCGV